jgi:hypothetical protein
MKPDNHTGEGFRSTSCGESEQLKLLLLLLQGVCTNNNAAHSGEERGAWLE